MYNFSKQGVFLKPMAFFNVDDFNGVGNFPIASPLFYLRSIVSKYLLSCTLFFFLGIHYSHNQVYIRGGVIYIIKIFIYDGFIPTSVRSKRKRRHYRRGGRPLVRLVRQRFYFKKFRVFWRLFFRFRRNYKRPGVVRKGFFFLSKEVKRVVFFNLCLQSVVSTNYTKSLLRRYFSVGVKNQIRKEIKSKYSGLFSLINKFSYSFFYRKKKIGRLIKDLGFNLGRVGCFNVFGLLLKYDLCMILPNRFLLDFVFLDTASVTAKIFAGFISRGLLLGGDVHKLVKYFGDIVRKSTNCLGYRVECSGRFSRKQRKDFFQSGSGTVPWNTTDAVIDFYFQEVILKYGICGIKVWIHRKSVSNFYKYQYLMK